MIVKTKSHGDGGANAAQESEHRTGLQGRPLTPTLSLQMPMGNLKVANSKRDSFFTRSPSRHKVR